MSEDEKSTKPVTVEEGGVVRSHSKLSDSMCLLIRIYSLAFALSDALKRLNDEQWDNIHAGYLIAPLDQVRDTGAMILMVAQDQKSMFDDGHIDVNVHMTHQFDHDQNLKSQSTTHIYTGDPNAPLVH